MCVCVCVCVCERDGGGLRFVAKQADLSLG